MAPPYVVSVDFDDTLIESETLKRAVLLDIASTFACGVEAMSCVQTDARQAGLRVTRHTIFRDFAFELARRGVISEESEALGRRLAAQYTDRVDVLLSCAAEVDGAQLLLRHLREHEVPVFINSATPQAPLEAVVRARGWETLVAGILGSPDGGGDKVANLQRIADRTGATAATMVHVGDGDNDASAAARFGCTFVSVRAEREGALATVLNMRGAALVLSTFCNLPVPLELDASRCRICHKNADMTGLPFGCIWTSRRWRLFHASSPCPVVGWLMLHSKRHFASPSDFDDAEAAEFGPLLRHLQSAMLRVTCAKRIYACAMAETSPHFHMHLVPRQHDISTTGFDLFGLQARCRAAGTGVDDALIKVAVDRLQLDLKSNPPPCDTT